MDRLWLRCWLAGIALAAGVFAQEPSEEPVPTDATFGTTVVIPAGLRGSVYLLAKDTMVLPDFEHDPVEHVGEIWTNELNVQPRHWRSGFPGLTQRFEWFAVDYTGNFWIANPGRYTFALLSDDGSRLFLDDTPVIDNDCQHSPDVRVAAVRLEGGVHRIRVCYFQGPRDCLALVLAVAGPDRRWRVFDVREFKPPSNPEEWHFSAAGASVIVPTTPEEASLTVKALSKQLLVAEPANPSKMKVKGEGSCGWGSASRTCSKE